MTLTDTTTTPRQVPTDLGVGVNAPTAMVDVHDPSGTLVKHLPKCSPAEVAAFLQVAAPGYQLSVTVNAVTR
jgi:hypothetical protein